MLRRFKALTTLRVMIALVGMLAVVVAGQQPASAHSKTIYHGNDYAYVTANHEMGLVYDQEVDGHYVCAEWRDEFDTYKECDGGDHQGDRIGPFDWPVEEFRICEENKGCTKWHSV